MTSTTQVPAPKLWKPTTKPFVFEISGTLMKGADDEDGVGVERALGGEVGEVEGDAVSVGEGVATATGSITCKTAGRGRGASTQTSIPRPPITPAPCTLPSWLTTHSVCRR